MRVSISGRPISTYLLLSALIKMEKKLLKRFEEMDETERGKLKELLKDSKKDSSDGNKLSWMYKDKADSEEYLLGRRVDSGVIDTEPDNTDSAGALFNEVITRRSELDMQVKMREDPLYAIRKREEEVKRRLLENPIKMKQLQKVVEEQKKQHKHKDKKKKKTKKHRKRSRSESTSSSDDELLKKYLAVVGNKKESSLVGGSETDTHGSGQRSEKGQGSRTDQRSEQDHRSEQDGGQSERTSHRDQQKSHSSNRDSKHRDDKYEHRLSKNKQHDDSMQRDRRRDVHRDGRHDASVARQRDERKHCERQNDKQTVDKTFQDTSSSDEVKQRQKLVGYGLITSSRYQPRLQASNNTESNKDSNIEMKQASSSKSDAGVSAKPAVKRKLTEQEMAAKREAMMRNARERDEQREQNVKRYKAEDERESKTQDQHKAAAFVKPMIMKHATESSVEDRLKRNVYNIQRTTTDLDKNFTKR